jgi:hypothetical protein
MVDYQKPKNEETIIFRKPVDTEEETQVMKPRRGVYKGIKYLKRVVDTLVNKTNIGIILKSEYSGKPLTFGKRFYVFLSYKNQAGEQIDLLDHPILYEVTKSDDDPKKPQYRPVNERERTYGNMELQFFIQDPSLEGKQRRDIEVTVEIKDDFGVLETQVMTKSTPEETTQIVRESPTRETQRVVPESEDNFVNLKRYLHNSTVIDLQKIVKEENRRKSRTARFTPEPPVNKSIQRGRKRFE